MLGLVLASLYCDHRRGIGWSGSRGKGASERSLLPISRPLIQGYRIGGAYKIPPAVHNAFSPRGIPSFEPVPTLRS